MKNNIEISEIELRKWMGRLTYTHTHASMHTIKMWMSKQTFRSNRIHFLNKNSTISRWQRRSSANLVLCDNLFMQLRLHTPGSICQRQREREWETEWNLLWNGIWSLSKLANVRVTHIILHTSSALRILYRWIWLFIQVNELNAESPLGLVFVSV